MNSSNVPLLERDLRIGYGEDAHALTEGRALLLGGVLIPDAPRGAVAHSDGDALLHALTDALLSAWSAGDIGALFPDSDASFSDADSALLLQRALSELNQGLARGWRVEQISAVVTLDHPHLGRYRSAMAERISALTGGARVGISFKTSEGLAPDHVQARAVALWTPRTQP
jgi:2-C-methyl-D-erythritol 2,4-cyclodiphosphate synthase